MTTLEPVVMASPVSPEYQDCRDVRSEGNVSPDHVVLPLHCGHLLVDVFAGSVEGGQLVARLVNTPLVCSAWANAVQPSEVRTPIARTLRGSWVATRSCLLHHRWRRIPL